MVQPYQKDSLTKHQLLLHQFMKIASPVNELFNGNELNPGEFMNSRVVAVPDIRVDDYIVDTEIARIGVNHYEGSAYTSKWKNGIPPIEWREYSMSRHRSFGYTVFAEQERYMAIPNLKSAYLARKMETTVLRDHDKYLLLAICLGRMTGKLVARTTADAYTSQIESTTGISAAEVACTGNQADYTWIAQPGERSDNEVQPSFATIKGMTIDPVDPLKTLDALTLMFTENWFDTNYSNSERFFLVTSAMEMAFRDALIDKGAYVESGFDLYRNADGSGANGPSYLGTLRGSWRLHKIHPEFLPKVFVDSNNVVDPNPVLTGVATAANRTLKQVVGLAAYKGSAQTHDFFSNSRSEDGGVRFEGTEYVQDMAYDAWVIDQKSEGIVPIFLPTDLDGNGSTDFDYTPVNDQFTRVAQAVAAGRTNKGTGRHASGPYPTYPISGPDVNLSKPEWYHQERQYATTQNLDGSLAVQATGDGMHRNPVLPGDNPNDAPELAGIVAAVVGAAAARVNSTAVTSGSIVKIGNTLWQVTANGTTHTAAPSITGKVVGDTVTDGTATIKRIL